MKEFESILINEERICGPVSPFGKISIKYCFTIIFASKVRTTPQTKWHIHHKVLPTMHQQYQPHHVLNPLTLHNTT